MNTVNSSTGFSPFQLRMGHLPCLIPPIMPHTAGHLANDEDECMAALPLIKRINTDVIEAQDDLLSAKLNQAEFANQHCAEEDVFSPGDKVWLSMEHCRWEYIQAKLGHMAKFIPRFDSPFIVTKVNPTKSSYTLELPNKPNRFTSFHSSLLHQFVPNDNNLFPSRKLSQPSPVITPEGKQEWLIE